MVELITGASNGFVVDFLDSLYLQSVNYVVLANFNLILQTFQETVEKTNEHEIGITE